MCFFQRKLQILCISEVTYILQAISNIQVRKFWPNLGTAYNVNASQICKMRQKLQQHTFNEMQRSHYSLLFLHSELCNFTCCLLTTEKGEKKTLLKG